MGRHYVEHCRLSEALFGECMTDKLNRLVRLRLHLRGGSEVICAHYCERVKDS